MITEITELQTLESLGLQNKENLFEGFFLYKPSWLFTQFINRYERIICLFTGNQRGKTSLVAYSYVMRIMGMHPIEAKNMRPNKKIRTYRFASESLPADADRDEQVRNTQYPEFKKWLPPCLIKKDITARSPVITLFDPQGGPDVNIEFVSFNQTVQSQAGQKRASVWIDESANKEFYEEQLPRLLASDGDLIYTLTPAEYVGFEFDEFFEKASIYIREQAVCDRMFERTGKRVKRIEKTDSNSDVAVLMAATDGNPIYPELVAEKNKNAIELISQGNHPTVFKIEDYQPVTVDDYIGDIIGTMDDETIDIRRYGLFRQSSGQIFKDFDVRTHVISQSKYFTEGVPHGWIHARGIDYHEHVPWAVGFFAISPQNEVFVYDELNPSPEKMITLQIAQIIANKSRDFKFKLNLIDPLAAKKQSNTGLSTIDDLNRIFSQFRKDGICTGGYWQSWDTKSTRGREEVRSRLRNSKLVGKPFSNRVVKNGVTEYLPTLWILDNCYNFKESFKNWRREEWTNRESLLTKDEKDKPQQRFSHFPMVIEALFKHTAFSSGRYKDQFVKDRDTHKHYFQREAYG